MNVTYAVLSFFSNSFCDANAPRATVAIGSLKEMPKAESAKRSEKPLAKTA
jgi:hypothetical protein